MDTIDIVISRYNENLEWLLEINEKNSILLFIIRVLITILLNCQI